MNLDSLTFFFLLFSFGLLLSASLVVFFSNPVHSVIALVFSFVFAASLWLLLKAEFLAILLILLYVGAVLVLFLFVVMMISRADQKQLDTSQRSPFFPLALALAILLFLQILYALVSSHFGLSFYAEPMPYTMVTVAQIGHILFTRYFYPFELLSILLFLGVLSAVVLVHQPRHDQKHQDREEQLSVQASDRLRRASFPPSHGENL